MSHCPPSLSWVREITFLLLQVTSAPLSPDQRAEELENEELHQ